MEVSFTGSTPVGRQIAAKAGAHLKKACVELGGTITGEHGIGLAKKKFLRGAIGEGSLQLMAELKRTLDPEGLLNPGKIFDL